MSASDAFPVAPDAVRVWRGWKQPDLDHPTFWKHLGEIFIPSAVQTQAPAGLTAYLPAVTAADAPDSVPDEIALVFYESQEVYQASFSATASRAYGFLHRTIFDPSRWKSGWPLLLGEEFRADQAYHLFAHDVDWQSGQTVAFVGHARGGAAFAEDVHRALRKVQASPPAGLDGAVVVFGSDHLVYWEHWAGEAPTSVSLLDALERHLAPVLDAVCTPVRVPAGFFLRYPGLEVEGGHSLNTQFARRTAALPPVPRPSADADA